MALVTSTVLAIAAIAVSATAANVSRIQNKQAAAKSREAQMEQKASAAQKAAQERRQQIREERIRRARILQSSEGTGTAGSSGEAGATGSMATQLGSNIGFNLGQIASASRVGDLMQEAANSTRRAGDFAALSSFAMNNAGTIGRIGGNIFSPSEVTKPGITYPGILE